MIIIFDDEVTVIEFQFSCFYSQETGISVNLLF